MKKWPERLVLDAWPITRVKSQHVPDGDVLGLVRGVTGSSQHVPTEARGLPWSWILSVLEGPEHNIG